MLTTAIYSLPHVTKAENNHKKTVVYWCENERITEICYLSVLVYSVGKVHYNDGILRPNKEVTTLESVIRLCRLDDAEVTCSMIFMANC